MSVSRAEVDQRNVGIQAAPAPTSRKYPKQILGKDQDLKLAVGTQVRLVNAAYRKASLKGHLKYEPLASMHVYTVTKQLRGRLDTPLRVLIQNNTTGEIMKHGYSIYELVILPGGRDEQPRMTAATRAQGTLLRKSVSCARVAAVAGGCSSRPSGRITSS